MITTQRLWKLVLGVLIPISILLLSGIKASAQEYVIGPQDTLTITVVDHPELGGTMMVAPDGSIQVPVIGQIPVVGLTIPNLTKQLVAGYKVRLVAPEVYVFLAARTPLVYALGMVAHPGVFPLMQNTQVLGLLASAGGLGQPIGTGTTGGVGSPAQAGQYNAKLLRKATGQLVPVDLVKVLAGDAAANLTLAEGDVLIVDALSSQAVYVTGDVDTPGMYQLPVGGKVSQALALARGVHGKLEEKQASILRNRQTLPVDLAKVYAPDGAGDLVLQDGDVLNVASVLLTLTISGEVRAAGTYPMMPGLSLSAALNLAGGVTPSALLTAVTVTHTDGTQQVVNLSTAAPPGAKSLLRDGDRIFVPTALVQVIVAGEVKTPGPYAVSPEMRASDLLALAGGPTLAAALTAVKVIHVGGMVETVDATTAKLELKDGDRVLVPTLFVGVTVLGEVKQPGPYQLSPNMTVADAIAQAGGSTTAAALTAVTVVHAGGALETVDATTTKLTLKDGDRIIVASSFVTVNVAGEVKTPGAYLVTPQLSLSDLLTLTGGPTAAASLKAIQVMHIGGRTESLDPATAKPIWRDGDRVWVPTLFVVVTVLGEVKQPGPYELSPTMTVADALAQAGGGTPVAALTAVTVVHAGGTVETVDATTTKLTVKDGDRITVASSFVTVNVAGEVKTPGAYQVTPQLSLADLLTLAGGLTPAASLKAVQVMHLGGKTESLDQATAKPTWRDGDRITVPSSFVTVNVAGEVKTPGAYQVTPQLSLADLLTLAGGLTQAASLKTVQVMHLGGRTETLDPATAKPIWLDGDRLVVSSQFISITLAGEVAAPGSYLVAPTVTIAGALTAAGGVSNNAATAKVQVLHVGGAVETVDASATLVVRDGDRITVPVLFLNVVITGEVRVPGPYQLTPAMTVADAMAMASGALGSADLGKIQVAHTGGVVEVVNAAAKTPLKDGDRIFVPSSLITVTITGEVQTSGSYQFASKTTLADALVVAGGPTVAASLAAVKIMHTDGSIDTVDTSRGTQTLRDGDRVMVPMSLLSVTIGGEVKTPGVYQVGPRTSLADALTIAGGTTLAAATQAVKIVHIGGETETVNAMTAAVTLKNGDRILVPSASISVAVSGEVKSPGSYQMGITMTAADAIAIAGGATSSAALQQVKIIRLSGMIETVDATATKSLLHDGDRVLVPTWLISVAVTGEVKTTGTYQLSPTMTAADAIVIAGGATIAAAMDRVQITHLGGATEVVDVAKAKEPLKDGDRLLVPTALVNIIVNGEVRTPGAYQLAPQMTAADAIALAGGPLPTALLDRVQLMHVGGAMEMVNLATTTTTLKEGDRLTVSTALVSITVSGEVKMPGVYQVSRQMTAVDVITIAGGATPSASLGAIQVIHVGGAVETVDANTTKIGLQHFLTDGDRILVPSSTTNIMIWGSVKSPGLYPIDETHPFSLAEALTRAQGPADGSGNKISVARVTDGTPHERVFDINTVMLRDPQSDITLAPNDVVFVAKEKQRYSLRNALQDLAQALTVAVLLQKI